MAARLGRDLRLRRRGHVHRPEARLRLAERPAQQEPGAVGRPLDGRPPGRGPRVHDAFRVRRPGLDDDDVGVLPVAAVGRVGDPAAVGRPAGRDVARRAAGEPDGLRLRVREVLEVELVVLVAAHVGGVKQERPARLHPSAPHGFDAAGQRDASREGRVHQVQVRGVADARRHERGAARRVPAAEARAPEAEVGREFGGERGRDGRHALGDDVRRRRGARRDAAGEQAEEGGAEGGAAHVLSLVRQGVRPTP